MLPTTSFSVRIPEEMLVQMQMCKGKVNWSKIARSAFQRKLNQFAPVQVRPKLKRMQIKLIGTSSLICHRWPHHTGVGEWRPPRNGPYGMFQVG